MHRHRQAAPTCWALLVTLVVVAILSGSCSGQTFHFGSCPRLPVVKNFDINKFEGRWYEYSKNRRYYRIDDVGARCATETYTVNQDGRSVRVVNRGVRIAFARPYSEEGSGYMDSPARFRFTFPSNPFFPQDVPLDVLDTDYESFAVVWSCSNRVGMNGQVVKILTRDVQPDPAVIRKAYQALDVNRIGRSAFSRTPQSEDCDYSDRNRFNKRPGRKPFRN